MEKVLRKVIEGRGLAAGFVGLKMVNFVRVEREVAPVIEECQKDIPVLEDNLAILRDNLSTLTSIQSEYVLESTVKMARIHNTIKSLEIGILNTLTPKRNHLIPHYFKCWRRVFICKRRFGIQTKARLMLNKWRNITRAWKKRQNAAEKLNFFTDKFGLRLVKIAFTTIQSTALERELKQMSILVRSTCTITDNLITNSMKEAVGLLVEITETTIEIQSKRTVRSTFEELIKISNCLEQSKINTLITKRKHRYQLLLRSFKALYQNRKTTLKIKGLKSMIKLHRMRVLFNFLRENLHIGLDNKQRIRSGNLHINQLIKERVILGFRALNYEYHTKNHRKINLRVALNPLYILEKRRIKLRVVNGFIAIQNRTRVINSFINGLEYLHSLFANNLLFNFRTIKCRAECEEKLEEASIKVSFVNLL